LEGLGRVDILVNNAGGSRSFKDLHVSEEAWQEAITLNFHRPRQVADALIDQMIERQWGRIINIGSMAASLEPIGDSMYAACKAGLSTLANVMAKEFAAMNVTCNTLGINAIESDMLAQLPRDKIDAIIAGLPVPRMSKEDDILNVIDFFASESSSQITAQTVFLGGVN
jgi:3-oxoacyl-[acyl-carrier protein] reductase